MSEALPLSSGPDGTAPLALGGTEVDEVFVEIDYAILQHFSKHLYASPNKAIEELVTNGYDALAQRVDVYLPGTWAEDCLIVWDDGTSMDIDALKHLWWIARSPKAGVGDDRLAVSADGRTARKMVGKFGIGKLASYAVGDRLTHLCRQDNQYLLVSVDYKNAPRLDDSSNHERGFRTPIQRLDRETAENAVRSLLRTEPENLQELLNRESWTVAFIDSIRDDVPLTEGRLKWVLGNGMPLRPDFAVYVNGEAVEPSALKEALKDWNMSSLDLQKALVAAWADAAQIDAIYSRSSLPPFSGPPSEEDTLVDSSSASDASAAEQCLHGSENASSSEESQIQFATDDGAAVVGGGSATEDKGLADARRAYADIPGLGIVRARIRLFEASLREGRSADHGRSEGFFIYVKGRLINPDDAKLLLADPSFGTFNRMQVTIWADGLDDDLLADRERLQQASATAAPLQLLQKTLYLTGRAALDKHDAAESQKDSPITVLPSESREFFRQPLTALALRKQAEGRGMVNLRTISMDQSPGSDSAPLMSLEPDQNLMVLNTAHPLYMAVRQRVGDSRRGREALRLVELVGLSDLLFEGHMLDTGVDEAVVDQLTSWRSSQLRGIAVRYASNPEAVIAETYEASYPGKSRFEKALAQLFQLMGFITKRDGLSGVKDVLVAAPLGAEALKFTIEAKGSKAPVENDAAEISGASAHAKAAGARFALVVAREFAGFKAKPDGTPAVLQECSTQNPPVAIATVETLEALYDALHANHYPLSSLVPVLEKVESPASKLAAVKALQRPTAKFDVRGLLDVCWEKQQTSNSSKPVSLIQLQTSRPEWAELSDDNFERIVFSVDAMSGGLLTFNREKYAVTMQQSPSIVADAITAAVEAIPSATERSTAQESASD